ncbi:unnamed protein product, partial [Rotaria socialis]
GGVRDTHRWSDFRYSKTPAETAVFVTGEYRGFLKKFSPWAVPKCKYNTTCNKRGDPIHRAQYRHSDLSDYLVPCRNQQSCVYKNETDHKIKYSHGERVPLP